MSFGAILRSGYYLSPPAVAERDITNKVYGVIKGIPVPFPLSEADACKLGVSCPVSANTDVNEKAIFIILKEYPSVSLSCYKLSSGKYDENVI